MEENVLIIFFHFEPCRVLFQVISDIIAHWYAILNAMILAINVFNAKEMIFASMSIISNHDGNKCLTDVFHLELCGGMFKVISDIMAHCYAINIIIFAINFCNEWKNNCGLFFFHKE